MKKDIYWYITILAMIIMPAAAAINFGDAAYDAMLLRTMPFLAIVAGIATGIGFEAVGILAGHRAVAFYSQGDSRWKLAMGILTAYIAIGMGELITVPFARFVPLLAGMVYVLAGLENQSIEENKQKQEDDSYQKKLDLLQVKLDHERQMKQDELNTQVKIERVKAKRNALPQRQDARQDAGNLMASDWRQLSDNQKYQLAHLTREEREEKMPEIADRTRRQWHKRLDEIAAQNGNFMA